MVTNPNEICLDEEDRASLTRITNKNGKPWREVFREAIATYEQRTVPADEGDIDEEI